MRVRPVVVLCAGLALAWIAPVWGQRSPSVRPNVVFVLADDLGVADLGVYGRTDHRTPRLDRLAAEGTRFTSAYAAAAVCSPSRAALLTGLAPARLHLTTFLPGRADAPTQRLRHPVMRQALPLEHVTLAEHLAGAGYATAAIGKWHLGGAGFGPADQGFAFVHGGTANTAAAEREGSKGEDDLTTAAERFIDANRERPFFLYLAHNTPHIPYSEVPSRVAAAGGAFDPTYAAVIARFDEVVGRLLDHVERAGLAGRTIVIVTSDNGGLHVPEGPHARVTHNGGFRAGKGFLYEGGLRIPLLVRWPGRVPAGRITPAPFVNTDWFPTLLELAGLPVPAGLDGVSQRTLLLGGAEPPVPRPVFWHMPHYTNQGGKPSGAARQGDWKIVEDYETRRIELYRLDVDPRERHDLSAREPARLDALHRLLQAWRRDVGAQENTPNPAVDPEGARALYETFDATRFDPRSADAAAWAAVAAWRKRMDRAVSARR